MTTSPIRPTADSPVRPAVIDARSPLGFSSNALSLLTPGDGGAALSVPITYNTRWVSLGALEDWGSQGFRLYSLATTGFWETLVDGTDHTITLVWKHPSRDRTRYMAWKMDAGNNAVTFDRTESTVKTGQYQVAVNLVQTSDWRGSRIGGNTDTGTGENPGQVRTEFTTVITGSSRDITIVIQKDDSTYRPLRDILPIDAYSTAVADPMTLAAWFIDRNNNGNFNRRSGVTTVNGSISEYIAREEVIG